MKDVLADPAVRRVLDARFAPAGARIPAAGAGDAKDGLLVKLNY
ncbi:MAG TPA: hypothetical protein PKJ05_06760 [Bacillota bacterium]|nr:hypothetical protein [Bacillota bacterium]